MIFKKSFAPYQSNVENAFESFAPDESIVENGFEPNLSSNYFSSTSIYASEAIHNTLVNNSTLRDSSLKLTLNIGSDLKLPRNTAFKIQKEIKNYITEQIRKTLRHIQYIKRNRQITRKR